MTDFSVARNALLEQLRELQQNRCGICGHDGALVLDHDHGSGLIRGYLCGPCNTAEGHHSCDTIAALCPICRWRWRPAVTWLGFSVVYDGRDGPFGIPLEPYQPTKPAITKHRDADRRAAEILERIVNGPRVQSACESDQARSSNDAI